MELREPPLRDPLTDTSWGGWFTQLVNGLNFARLWNIRTVTTNYTVQKFDSVILLNGDITVTLPTVKVGDKKRITVKVINTGGGTRTVSGGGANIDGAATATTTTQYTSWDFVTDGTNWFIV